MEITSKGRYAVRIMADIARNDSEYVSTADISKRQGISLKYLERIISMLSRANLVESMRGVNGGYKLQQPADKITVKQILDATGDKTNFASCTKGEACPMADRCDSMSVWHTLNNLINGYLSSVTLSDLINKTYK